MGSWAVWPVSLILTGLFALVVYVSEKALVRGFAIVSAVALAAIASVFAEPKSASASVLVTVALVACVLADLARPESLAR